MIKCPGMGGVGNNGRIYTDNSSRYKSGVETNWGPGGGGGGKIRIQLIRLSASK